MAYYHEYAILHRLHKGFNMDREFKSSKYNHYLTRNDKLYIYNILSTAVIEVDKKLNTNLLCDNIKEIQSEYIDDLLKNNFIINNSEVKEHEKYLYFYNKARFNNSRKSFVLTLIPTYSCNLACPYCLQGQEKKKTFISNENLSSVYKFLSNEINEKSVKEKVIESLVIRFYGGEPFLHKNIIQDFCIKTSDIARKHNIPVKYDMPTNFTIIDDQILSTIKMFNISIQVSIDGTKDLHDLRRINKSGEGTFDVILSNLKKACDEGLKENITLRINIDQDNIDSAEKCLLDVCSYAGHVYFGMLSPYQGYNDPFTSSCIACSDYSELLATKLNPLLVKHGNVSPMMFGKQGPCSINSENKFYVDDKLNVYKCEVLVNRDEFCIGKIKSNGELLYNENFYHQMNFTPSNFDECISCKLLPMCGAGCPAKKYLASNGQNGKLDKKNCQYSENDLNKYLAAYVDTIL